MRQVKSNLFQYSPEIPSKLISAHTFAYISLDAMIPQEADQTHIEYGFPVDAVDGGTKSKSLKKPTGWNVSLQSVVVSGS